MKDVDAILVGVLFLTVTAVLVSKNTSVVSAITSIFSGLTGWINMAFGAQK